jgi:CheY-like chemotaxis protein
MPHVLIVDKDPALGRALEARLAFAGGVGVLLAQTLEDASRLLAEQRPVLVFVDCHLPDGDGLEWYRRASASYPESRFALMSWQPVPPQAWTGVENAVAVWMRPFDCERVVRLLEDVLREPDTHDGEIHWLRGRLAKLAAGLWEVRGALQEGDWTESSLQRLADQKIDPILVVATAISERMRGNARGHDHELDHRTNNHMATVLAGVHVLAGELRASEPEQVRGVVVGLVEDLLDKVGLMCAMVERRGTEG